jgi:hypothetical protein
MGLSAQQTGAPLAAPAAAAAARLGPKPRRGRRGQRGMAPPQELSHQGPAFAPRLWGPSPEPADRDRSDLALPAANVRRATRLPPAPAVPP